MHGAHRSKNVPRGQSHPQYRNGEWTKEALEGNRAARCRLAMLEQIGWHFNMFIGEKTRGKKPQGFLYLDLTDPEQLEQAVLMTLAKE